MANPTNIQVLEEEEEAAALKAEDDDKSAADNNLDNLNDPNNIELTQEELSHIAVQVKQYHHRLLVINDDSYERKKVVDMIEHMGYSYVQETDCTYPQPSLSLSLSLSLSFFL